MRAEEGDESVQNYAEDAEKTQERVAGRSWPTRLRDALTRLVSRVRRR